MEFRAPTGSFWVSQSRDLEVIDAQAESLADEQTLSRKVYALPIPVADLVL
jgi:hypothetical protein